VGYTKVIHSGSLLEIYSYERDLEKERRPNVRKNGYNRTNRFSATRRADSVGRLKKCFLRLVRANLVGDVSPSLVTVTMFQICGIRHACNVVTAFIQRLRRREGKIFRYIAVPEFQRRGAVHFHCMIWGLSDNIILDERNNRYIQNVWLHGFVDCIKTDGSGKLASYISKYMSKTMQDKRLLGKKAYLASGNLLRSVSFKTDFALQHLAESQGLDLSTDKPLQDFKGMTKWLGQGRYRLFKLNHQKNGSDNESDSYI